MLTRTLNFGAGDRHESCFERRVSGPPCAQYRYLNILERAEGVGGWVGVMRRGRVARELGLGGWVVVVVRGAPEGATVCTTSSREGPGGERLL